jgi:Tfp pilus assembly protein PilN
MTLNFGPMTRRTHQSTWWVAVVAVTLAIAAAADLAQSLGGAAQQREALADAALRESAQAEPEVRPAASVDPVVIARNRSALQVQARLKTPWNTLLNHLEALTAAPVALLSVEPMPQKDAVRLVAEAGSSADMLDYLASLQTRSGLTEVSLISHQSQLLQPGKPVRFQVQGTWRTHP